ncbi:hypothetical protein [Roseibium sp.]|uniref:hypothetical protein n=1 Tax=Roseibium sp. TaxID=1936156 RepID=UPI003BAA48E4
MKRLYTPSLPEIFRIDTSSLDSTETHLELLFLKSGGKFNYLSATKSLLYAFKGLHNLDQLVAGCETSGSKIGRQFNVEVAKLASPVAFGRKTQVFDFPRRQFRFGADRAAPFRVPFFFVEDEIIKILFLQPAKSGGLAEHQLGGLFTVLKKHLLDREFYGEQTDIEYIDTSSPTIGGARQLTRKSLIDVKLWTEDMVAEHLTMIAKALSNLEARGLAEDIKPRRPFKDPELPLFD